MTDSRALRPEGRHRLSALTVERSRGDDVGRIVVVPEGDEEGGGGDVYYTRALSAEEGADDGNIGGPGRCGDRLGTG